MSRSPWSEPADSEPRLGASRWSAAFVRNGAAPMVRITAAAPSAVSLDFVDIVKSILLDPMGRALGRRAAWSRATPRVHDLRVSRPTPRPFGGDAQRRDRRINRSEPFRHAIVTNVASRPGGSLRARRAASAWPPALFRFGPIDAVRASRAWASTRGTAGRAGPR